MDRILEALFKAGGAGLGGWAQATERLDQLELDRQAQEQQEAWRQFQRERALADMVARGTIQDAGTPEMTTGADLFTGGAPGLGMQAEVAPDQTYAAQRVAAETEEPELDRATSAIEQAGNLFAGTADVPGMTDVPNRDYYSEYDGPVYFEDMGGYRPSTPDEMLAREEERLALQNANALDAALEQARLEGELANELAVQRERERMALAEENPEIWNIVSGQGYLNRPASSGATGQRYTPTEEETYLSTLESAREEASKVLRSNPDLTGPERVAIITQIADLYQVDHEDMGLAMSDSQGSEPPLAPSADYGVGASMWGVDDWLPPPNAPVARQSVGSSGGSDSSYEEEYRREVLGGS